MPKKSKTAVSFLDRRIGKFPLLKPFLIVLVALFILFYIDLAYTLQNMGHYDKEKYARYTQVLAQKERAFYEELGLSRPLATQTDSTGYALCYFTPAGFGVIYSHDSCYTSYTAVHKSIPDPAAINQILSEHNWTVSDASNFKRYKEAYIDPNTTSLQADIIYFRSEPGVKYRVEISRCNRSSKDCLLSSQVFASSPSTKVLYEVRVKADVESHAIQKWNG